LRTTRPTPNSIPPSPYSHPILALVSWGHNCVVLEEDLRWAEGDKGGGGGKKGVEKRGDGMGDGEW